ncbi:MAG: nucleoside-diphosphate kinase [Candidatus Dojkabacteria bacterium]|nr:MAG: nucleoside-diphosphate kinase [Candidatus Dojkabacteria bacterium]
MLQESTLVIIKADSVKRGLVGRILQKFEDIGLKITKLQLIVASEEQAQAHYAMGKDEKWLQAVGEKALSLYKSQSHAQKIFHSCNPIEIGKVIYQWSIKQLTKKSIVVVVLYGPNAVEKVKKVAGSHMPAELDLSTIRGMYSTDSLALSHAKRRALFNTIHRSTSRAEAKREISVWFPKE